MMLCVFMMRSNDVVCATPYQHFYTRTTADDHRVRQNCEVWTWFGRDPTGMTDFPSVTKVDCSRSGRSRFEFDEILTDGAVTAYMTGGGRLTLNNNSLTMMGESFWSQTGSRIVGTLDGGGVVLFVGGRLYSTHSNASSEAQFPSLSYLAPRERAYQARNASVVGDVHIQGENGTAKDLLWSSESAVDPPNVVVINCYGTSHVRNHFHPQGAVYIPFTGTICFQSSSIDTQCIEPGELRWTSALLRYYETFHAPNESSTFANVLLDAVGQRDLCTFPTVFAVTSFDPDDPAGQPNFIDIPSKTMTVRTTKIIAKTITLDEL